MTTTTPKYTLVHYLCGALPARLGDEMSGQAILLAGLAATGSAALGSSLLAALTVSAALGGPVLGAVLDRARHPGRMLASALSLYAAGLALVGVMLGKVPVVTVLAIAFAAGFLMPALSGGWSSRLKTVVSAEQLARASAVDATTFNIAGLAGPGLAGLLAAWLGPGWAIGAVVCFMLAALPMAWRLPSSHREDESHGMSLPRQVMTGFRVIIDNRTLFRVTLVTVISCIGMGALWVIAPLMGRTLLGNAGYGGVLLSCLSLAALGATAVYARWPSRHGPERVVVATTLVLALGILTLAFARSAAGALVAMAVIGVADGPQLAATFEIRHREAPEGLRSQVFTTASSVKITAFAIGAALAGQFAAKSLEMTILASCAAQLLAVAAYVLVGPKRIAG